MNGSFVAVLTEDLFSTQDTLEELIKAEAMSDRLKTQLNDLCRFSREMGSQSDRVSALIKEYNRSDTCRRAVGSWHVTRPERWSVGY